MPSKTEKQREAMAIAEHEPGKLYKRNRGLLKMSHQQLHDFASAVKPGGKKKKKKKRKSLKEIFG